MIRYSKGKSGIPITLIISGLAVLLVLIWIFKPRIEILHEQTPIVTCRNNMKYLGLAIQMYADENSDSYPLPEKWCDLISPSLGDLANKIFYCPAMKDNQCYYAMNPNCKPTSPPDTVLLFETQNSSLNLSGGPELLSIDNHEGQACNVLFNDGSIKRIKKDEIVTLKWN